MKTPMQELITAIRLVKHSEINEQAWEAYDYVIDIAESLLEKEKEEMCQFAFDFAIECIDFHHATTMSPERFYELTYGGNNGK